MATWISAYAQPLATIGGAVLVVFVTPIIGAWAYFKQKEYETVRKRYLEDGLEGVIRQVEYGLEVFEYNWAHSVYLLRTYRDLGVDTPHGSYESGFLTIDRPVSIEASRHYLVKDLVGSDVFFRVHQLLTAFLHETDSLFRDDLCSAIKISIEGGRGATIELTPKELFDGYLDKLKKMRVEAHSYYTLLGVLQILASIFARKQYSFGGLSKFRKDRRVSKAIAELEKKFEARLAKNRSDPPTTEVADNPSFQSAPSD